jgi:hypothetical protein
MELLIFKIVIIVCLIRLIFLQVGHLTIAFNKKGNKMQVDEILKDPEKYVKWDHLETFMNNMIWLIVIISLIVAAFSGNVTFVNQ